MKNFGALIDGANAGYCARYPKELLDRLMFEGDPLADAAVAALHERRYDRSVDKLASVRALAAEGVPAARAFVQAVAEPPRGSIGPLSKPVENSRSVSWR